MSASSERQSIEKLMDQSVALRKRNGETYEAAYARLLNEDKAMQEVYKLYLDAKHRNAGSG